MQWSYRDKPHNKVDYFALPNGYADVFLHRNEKTEADEEGNVQYVAEEVYFQIEQSVTKNQIEDNFDFMWNDVENTIIEPSVEELQLEYMIDLDYRLSLIEMGLIQMTYIFCKKLIELGRYNEEDLLNKLDVFLLNDRITQSEYEELVDMINAV